MGLWRIIFGLWLLVAVPFAAAADDKMVRLFAPASLADTGLLGYMLPRFSLKTQVRVALADTPDGADVVLGAEGQALFQGVGQQWHMQLRSPGHAPSQRLADWLRSDIGQRTVLAYAPQGTALFQPPTAAQTAAVEMEFAGDAVLGQRLSREKCSRCHVVDNQTRMSGIGSTPSFAVLRSLPDWDSRFAAFFALNPHPAFTIIPDVTPAFTAQRPSPIVPITLSLDELEAILAYAASIEAADLGGALVHQ